MRRHAYSCKFDGSCLRWAMSKLQCENTKNRRKGYEEQNQAKHELLGEAQQQKPRGTCMGMQHINSKHEDFCEGPKRIRINEFQSRIGDQPLCEQARADKPAKSSVLGNIFPHVARWRAEENEQKATGKCIFFPYVARWTAEENK